MNNTKKLSDVFHSYKCLAEDLFKCDPIKLKNIYEELNCKDDVLSLLSDAKKFFWTIIDYENGRVHSHESEENDYRKILELIPQYESGKLTQEQKKEIEISELREAYESQGFDVTHVKDENCGKDRLEEEGISSETYVEQYEKTLKLITILCNYQERYGFGCETVEYKSSFTLFRRISSDVVFEANETLNCSDFERFTYAENLNDEFYDEGFKDFPVIDLKFEIDYRNCQDGTITLEARRILSDKELEVALSYINSVVKNGIGTELKRLNWYDDIEEDDIDSSAVGFDLDLEPIALSIVEKK